MNEQTIHNHHSQGHHNYRHPWPFLAYLERLGEEYLIRKAPWQLPQKWKEIIVKILPVIVMIVAILSIPGIFIALPVVIGIGGFYTNSYILVLLQLIITIIITALYFKSYDRLRKRQYAGWAYIFYAGLLGFVSHLLQGGFIRSVVGFIVGMYLIFQIRELYHS